MWDKDFLSDDEAMGLGLNPFSPIKYRRGGICREPGCGIGELFPTIPRKLPEFESVDDDLLHLPAAILINIPDVKI